MVDLVLLVDALAGLRVANPLQLGLGRDVLLESPA
jgi:hypothetical protein